MSLLVCDSFVLRLWRCYGAVLSGLIWVCVILRGCCFFHIIFCWVVV